MTTEAGDKKLIGNFSQLIEYVSADPNYNPANPKLTTAALVTQRNTAEAAATAVSAAQAPNKLAITERQSAFGEMRPRAIRAHNYLKASGASAGIIADADTSMTKLTGGRKTAKIKDDPKTPEAESKSSRSASQMSFDNQEGHLEAFLAILSNVPEYKPNEADLKLLALQSMAADLKVKSEAVRTTQVALSQARGVRDDLLYLAEDSIVAIAKLVKKYILAAFGTSSQLYKQTKGLKFTKPNR